MLYSRGIYPRQENWSLEQPPDPSVRLHISVAFELHIKIMELQPTLGTYVLHMYSSFPGGVRHYNFDRAPGSEIAIDPHMF